MDTKQVGSLAETFLKDPNAKAAYLATNPTSRNINNYIFSVDIVRDNVSCGMNNQCDWFQATAEERNMDDLHKLVLCITCDRVYHLRCTGLDFQTLPESQLPWICHKCKANPMNPEAQILVNEGKYNESFESRIKHFVKNSSAVDEPSDSDSDEEDLNQTIHVDNNLNPIPAGLLEQLQKLTQKYDKVVQKNKKLYETIKNYRSSSNDIAKSHASAVDRQSVSVNATMSVQANPSSHNQQDSNISYVNAVMNANAASTQIDDEIDRSRQQQNNFNISTAAPVACTSSSSQNEATLQHINALTLHEIRKSLPKIENFDGKPEKWLTFQRAVDRNWKEGRYSDELMKLHIRQALSGQALARVDSLIDMMTAKQIMEFLKESYGNSNVIVEQARQKLLNIKLSKPLTHSSCVEVTTLIASYMTACSYAGLLVADSSISWRIHQQLEPYHQQMYYEYYFRKYPTATTRIERLDIQFEFLNSISKTLPLGAFKIDDHRQSKAKGNYQVMITSVDASNSHSQSCYNKSQANCDESYKYEIRDQSTAKYLGYDMGKVREICKKCEICGRNNHFTVECRTYRDMRMDVKYNTVKSKGLCLNCLLTTSHSAKDCELKLCCGLKLDKNIRCTAKHHVTLHRSDLINFNNPADNKRYKKQQRRLHVNQNAQRASERISNYEENTPCNEPQIPQLTSTDTSNSTPSTSSPSIPSQNLSTIAIAANSDPKPYQQLVISTSLSCMNQSSHRTVKLFKTLFYSNKGKAIGYSLGDSGSEITLVRKDLVDDLGITGQPCMLTLQWTDSDVKSIRATKVKLRISGVGRFDEVLELDECYAVENLALAARSLNVDELKRKFPYLYDVPFESYHNAIPSVLIGSRHASMVEAVEPIIEGGNSRPIGIRTKLGYTIYGGAPECFEATHAVNVHQVNKDCKHLDIPSSVGSSQSALKCQDSPISSIIQAIRLSSSRKRSFKNQSTAPAALQRPSYSRHSKKLQFRSSSVASSNRRAASSTITSQSINQGLNIPTTSSSKTPSATTHQLKSVIVEVPPKNRLEVNRPKRRKKRIKGMTFDEYRLIIDKVVNVRD